MIRLALAFCGLLALVGCGAYLPASPPPQLRHTPGPAITVSAGEVEAGLFRLRYPSAWRVVKLSESHQGMRLAFVAPDGSRVELGQVDRDARDPRIVWLDAQWGLRVDIALSENPSPHFAQQAEALIASITTPLGPPEASEGG